MCILLYDLICKQFFCFVTDADKRASGRFVVEVHFSIWEFYYRKLTKDHPEMETRETKKTMSSRFRICWIINRMPVSVEEPHGVSFHSISILIAVPAIVSMGSVLDIENGMTKTGLAVCWVLWLWICHAAGQWGHVIFNYASKLEDIYIYMGIWVLLFNLLTLLLSLQDFLHRQW